MKSLKTYDKKEVSGACLMVKGIERPDLISEQNLSSNPEKADDPPVNKIFLNKRGCNSGVID